MGWQELVLWGAAGGTCMEALDFIIAVRRWRRMPWHIGSTSLAGEPGQTAPAGDRPSVQLPAPGAVAYWVAGVLRVGMGTIVAAAVGSSLPKDGTPWVLLVMGAAAPLLLEKLLLLVPLLQGAAGQFQPPQPPPPEPPSAPGEERNPLGLPSPSAAHAPPGTAAQPPADGDDPEPRPQGR